MQRKLDGVRFTPAKRFVLQPSQAGHRRNTDATSATVSFSVIFFFSWQMQKENVERICQTVTINSTFPYESFRSKFQQNPNSNSTTCCFHFQSPNDDKCETNNPKFPLSVRLKYAKVTLIRKKIKQITLINMHKDTIIAQQTDMRCNRHLNVIEQDLQGGKMQ